MHKGRLEAFSDGVIAILITIMVLELKAPMGGSFSDLRPLLPFVVNYALSFVYLAIYWNNHHHLLQAAEKVNGRILWANSHLLFWLSLLPFGTAWMGEHAFKPAPVALYGTILLLCAMAYSILEHALIAHHGDQSILAFALGRDIKGKASLLIYVLAIPLAFHNAWISYGCFVLVAILWLVPDRRIEKRLGK